MTAPVQADPPAHDSRRTASVTVAYEPDHERLLHQLDALAGQVDDIIIVDNGGGSPTALAALAGRATIVRPAGGNIGVAAGFNAGIEEARRRGAGHVVLFDQDSVPGEQMVPRLREALASRPGVAAAGPRVRDPRDGRDLPFVRIGVWWNAHCRCAEGRPYIPCDFLISSGALIDLAAFDAVGPFDEALFIDNIDLEWCLRARSKRFLLLGCCTASLDHRLGDRRVQVASAGQFVVHSPERLYYMTRNRLMLYRRPYMPWGWKWKDAFRAVFKCTALALLVPPRGQYAAMAFHGVRDALANRGGKREF